MKNKKHRIPENIFDRALFYYVKCNVNIIEKCDKSGKPLEIIIPDGLNSTGPCAYKIFRQGDEYAVKYITPSIEHCVEVENCVIRPNDRTLLQKMFKEIQSLKQTREEKDKKPKAINAIL